MLITNLWYVLDSLHKAFTTPSPILLSCYGHRALEQYQLKKSNFLEKTQAVLSDQAWPWVAFTRTLSCLPISSQDISFFLTAQVNIIWRPWVISFAAFTPWPKRSWPPPCGAEGEVSYSDLLCGRIHSNKLWPCRFLANTSWILHTGKEKHLSFIFPTVDLALWRLWRDPESAGKA